MFTWNNHSPAKLHIFSVAHEHTVTIFGGPSSLNSPSSVVDIWWGPLQGCSFVCIFLALFVFIKTLMNYWPHSDQMKHISFQTWQSVVPLSRTLQQLAETMVISRDPRENRTPIGIKQIVHVHWLASVLILYLSPHFVVISFRIPSWPSEKLYFSLENMLT